MEWIISNWTTCLAIFWMAEKVVKITPFPYDDILLDIVWSSIKKAVKKYHRIEKAHPPSGWAFSMALKQSLLHLTYKN